jgi:hypothetical protein
MRYLLPLILLAGCAVKADDKPAAPKESYTQAVIRFEAAIAANTETLGNYNAELGEVKEQLKTLKGDVKEIKSLLSVDSELSVNVPAPPAEPPPVKADAPPKDADRRILFQGKPINLSDWLHRRVEFVDVKGDLDAHLRDHGLDGDLSGLTHAQKLQLHSVAHSTHVPLKSSKVVVNAAVVLPQASGNCPNGNCARNWTNSWNAYQQATIGQRPRHFGIWR